MYVVFIGCYNKFCLGFCRFIRLELKQELCVVGVGNIDEYRDMRFKEFFEEVQFQEV